MIHLVPFIAGAAVGIGAVLLAKSDKAKLKEGKQFIADKAKEGVDAIKAAKECVSEKILSKKEGAKSKDESNDVTVSAE